MMKSLPMPQSAAPSVIFAPNYAMAEWENSPPPFAVTVGGTFCPCDDAGRMTHGCHSDTPSDCTVIAHIACRQVSLRHARSF
jgi:hypothetical protein